MTTIYVTHEVYRDHQMAGYGHPEHPGRIEAVWEAFKQAGLTARLHSVKPEPVTDQMILRVHTKEYLVVFDSIAVLDKMTMLDQDTYALPQSPEIARLSAGGAVTAIDAVMTGEAKNALAAVRPPGHHATLTRGMGFCLLSNVAIAARHAQVEYGIKRIMIVDFDVHHGNGTQDIFYEDPDVLFVSTHQYPFYPGTGHLRSIGDGEGVGATLNIPLPPGHGDKSYADLYEKVLWPVARRFRPELILVSAGFDAHHVDPLAMMRLTHTGYAHLSRELKRMADELCDEKIVFVMEGGYDLQALAHGMRNIAHVLLEEDEISDFYGAASGKDPDVGQLIGQLQQIHNI